MRDAAKPAKNNPDNAIEIPIGKAESGRSETKLASTRPNAIRAPQIRTIPMISENAKLNKYEVTQALGTNRNTTGNIFVSPPPSQRMLNRTRQIARQIIPANPRAIASS